MSDDKVITEQEEKVDEKPDTPADETLAFEEDDGKEELEDTGFEGLESGEKAAGSEKKPDEKLDDSEKQKTLNEYNEYIESLTDEQKEAAEELIVENPESPEDLKAEIEKALEDEDEDEARGKDLIAEEEKEAAAKKEAEESEKKTAVDGGVYDPRTTSKTEKQIQDFNGYIPPNFFPDTVTLEDGTVLDFKQTLNDQPEIAMIAASLSHNIIEQMTASGYLATDFDIKQVKDDLDNRLFLNSLTNSFDGVPKAQEIFKSDGFKEWIPKQPKEIQALMRSSDYKDHVRVFKRYLNKEGLDDAKKQVEGLDDKRKKDKKKFDSVHKTTLKSKGKPKKSAMSPEEQEDEGFNEKDDDDDFYT